jgi:hypothetical protein
MEIGGGFAQKLGGWTTPFLAKGCLAQPLMVGMGWPKPPQALGGDPPPPKAQTLFFFFFCLSGWSDLPQGPGGGFGHPILVVGGGSSHPDFLPLIYLFIYFYLKKKTKILKWPKLRHFGQNDVILGEPKTL